MSDWIRDVGIATIGAIIGAALIYVVQTGILFTQKSRAVAQAARKQEEKDWRAKDLLVRHTISNAYLFSILKLFMIGNMFWVASSIVSDMAGKDEPPQLDYARTALDLIGLIFFLATFAKILSFTKLQRLG